MRTRCRGQPLISARFKAAGSAQCLRLRVSVVFGFFEKHGSMCRVKKHRCPCLGTMQHSHHFLKGSSWTAIIYLPRRLKQQFLIFFSNISTSQESGKNNSMSGCYEWRYDISVSFAWNQTARGNELLRTWHCWERGLAVANCFSPEQRQRGAFPPSSGQRRPLPLTGFQQRSHELLVGSPGEPRTAKYLDPHLFRDGKRR